MLDHQDKYMMKDQWCEQWGGVSGGHGGGGCVVLEVVMETGGVGGRWQWRGGCLGSVVGGGGSGVWRLPSWCCMALRVAAEERVMMVTGAWPKSSKKGGAGWGGSGGWW
nr:hypothetical protein [Tanacetum cinerariifolium]